MRLLLALAALLLSLRPALADEMRPGYLEWTEQTGGNWKVTWKAPLLGGLATRARPLLPPGCSAVGASRRFDGPAMVETFSVHCNRSLSGRKIGLSGLENGFTDALLRVAPLRGGVQAERLTPDQPTAVVLERPSRSEVATTYLKLGITHIVFGYDHLLFVVALVLLIRGWRQIVATVTAFTVAHSLTLAAATLGWITVARKPIEVCIALSIVLVAREVLRDPDEVPTLARRWPGLVAFVFGLLHGFGFAAALAEIGLPSNEIPLALLTFNVGVEIGQLAIVLAALSVLAMLARFTPVWRVRMPHLAAYAIGTLASAWFIERALA